MPSKNKKDAKRAHRRAMKATRMKNKPKEKNGKETAKIKKGI